MPPTSLPRTFEPDETQGVPADFAERFGTSMPPRYRMLFDPRAVRRHAATAFRRGSGPARVEVWRSMADGTSEICVIADDRPGVLLRIAAALASHRWSVVMALIFSRVTDAGFREAVDLFWVQRASGDAHAVMGPEQAATLEATLAGLVRGTLAIDDVLRAAPPVVRRPGCLVRFESPDEGGAAVLTVSGADGPGVLLVLARTLYTQRTQVVRSLVRTVGGRVHNRFDLVEFDGSAPSPARRREIRLALEAALSEA
jgi:UTP:GlnB (protein PII) uridylyltransferase